MGTGQDECRQRNNVQECVDTGTIFCTVLKEQAILDYMGLCLLRCLRGRKGECRAGVISSSSGCSGLQEAFTVLLTYLLGVLGMASHAVFCCSHRMPDVGDAYRITQFSRLQSAKSTTQASGEDSHGCLLTWSLEAKGEVPVFRRVTCIRLEEESSQTDLPGATPVGLGSFLRDSPFMTVES